jgi:hypothetical protein
LHPTRTDVSPNEAPIHPILRSVSVFIAIFLFGSPGWLEGVPFGVASPDHSGFAIFATGESSRFTYKQ